MYSPDVYQTAKWNNLASIETSKNQNQFNAGESEEHRLVTESDCQESNTQSQRQESQALTKDEFKSVHVYQENFQLRDYLRKAYKCVIKFLNQYDVSQIQNSDLAEDLQVFAELEQNRRDLLLEENFNPGIIQSSLKSNDDNMTPSHRDKQTYESEMEMNEETPTSIESNVSGIKKYLKETKKSLLQAKKLLFQEKCINIDHERSIQELKQ